MCCSERGVWTKALGCQNVMEYVTEAGATGVGCGSVGGCGWGVVVEWSGGEERREGDAFCL